jgi:uncharacterized protein (DUF433 family)
VKQAMEKYQLSRDAVYQALKYYHIERINVRNHIKFLKVDFDRIMSVAT